MLGDQRRIASMTWMITAIVPPVLHRRNASGSRFGFSAPLARHQCELLTPEFGLRLIKRLLAVPGVRTVIVDANVSVDNVPAHTFQIEFDPNFFDLAAIGATNRLILGRRL